MANPLNLSREQLQKFLPDHQSIRAFEQMMFEVGTATPATIEQANNNANTAIAMAGAALAALAELATAIEQVSAAPVPEITYEQEDYSRIVYVGSLGMQNDDEVEITGGAINGTSIGVTTASTGAFTGLSYSLQLTSTVVTGTAPMVVSSTTKVNNLNVDFLDGADWAAPAAIGITTPNSAAFTSVSYAGQLTSTVATGTAPMIVASTTKVENLNVDLLDGKDWVAPGPIGGTTPDTGAFTSLTTTGAADSIFGLGTTINRLFVNGSNSGTGGGTRITAQNGGTSIIAIGNKSTIEGGAYDATPIIYANATIYMYQGIDINGDVKIIGKSGFNNTAPITKPSVTGSRAGNAALASLLTALSNYGLVTDSTTA